VALFSGNFDFFPEKSGRTNVRAGNFWQGQNLDRTSRLRMAENFSGGDCCWFYFAGEKMRELPGNEYDTLPIFLLIIVTHECRTLIASAGAMPRVR
jgi:hypothetical protein